MEHVGLLLAIASTMVLLAVPIIFIVLLLKTRSAVKRLTAEVKTLKEDSITQKFNDFVADFEAYKNRKA